MFRRTIALALSSLAVAWPCARPAAGGQVTTPLQTQSIPMTLTDWGPGTSRFADPLAFNRFDPRLGTLDAVTITMTATIRSDFELVFFATPKPTTLYVSTTSVADPAVLSDPDRVVQLTDGPSVSLTGPDGAALLGARMPVDVVSMTEAIGTYSSSLPVTDPNYIPPDAATFSSATTLDGTSGGIPLSAFVGSGTVGLPVGASARSSFYSDSGNGGGTVLTRAGVTVTLQYTYTPKISGQSVPEPSGLILMGLGAGAGLAAAAWRRSRRPELGDG